MKRIADVIAGIAGVIAVMVAAGTLAGCSADHADRYADGYLTEAEREAQETLEVLVAFYHEYFNGTFHGEHIIMPEIPVTTVPDIYWCEDMTFTPFDEPREISGVQDITAYGTAEITWWREGDDLEEDEEPETENCYYFINYNYPKNDGLIYTLDTPLSIHFYRYDPATGLTTGSGSTTCTGNFIDDDSLTLISYHKFNAYDDVVFTFVRQ